MKIFETQTQILITFVFNFFVINNSKQKQLFVLLKFVFNKGFETQELIYVFQIVLINYLKHKHIFFFLYCFNKGFKIQTHIFPFV